MYVRWKTLFGLGAILWTLLCVTDFFTDKPFQDYKKDDEWLADLDMTKEDFYTKTATQLNQLQIEEFEAEQLSFSFSWRLISWNLFAFVITILCCRLIRKMIIKGIKMYLNKKKPLLTADASTVAIPYQPETKLSNSKIPIPVQAKQSEISLKLRNVNGDDNNTDLTSISTITLDSKRIENERLGQKLEKQCNILKEEMITVKENSIKEHAVLTRKLETITREKRELSKQLAIAHKENRAAKQQLEELLAERAMLIKRLDNATREFKINTKTKKVTLAKLEEAHSKIDTLKLQLDEVLKDKEILEDRAKSLMEEYNKMSIPEKDTTNNIEIYEDAKYELSNDNKEHVIDNKPEDPFIYADKNNLSTLTSLPQNVDDDSTISQATIDMKKIQKKIEMLEKNLQKFKPHITMAQQKSKQPNEPQVETPHKSAQYNEIFTRPQETNQSKASICNKPDCPLEHEECSKLECLLCDIPHFNTLPNSACNAKDFLPKCCESLGNLGTEKKPYFILGNSTQSDSHYISSEDESGHYKSDSCSLSTSLLDQETTSPWNINKKGIVSRSPAFQKFLKQLEPRSKFEKNGGSLQTVA